MRRAVGAGQLGKNGGGRCAADISSADIASMSGIARSRCTGVCAAGEGQEELGALTLRTM